MILPDIITQRAKAKKDAVAFLYRDEQITYAELETRILRCAQSLASLGVKKGTTFGLLLRNCPEFVILSMALGKLGGIAVPINFLEKPDRVSLILNDAGAFGILTSREFLATVLHAAGSVKSLKHIFQKDGDSREAPSFQNLLKSTPYRGPVLTQENDLAMLLYTSGTTGLPKGVMLTHGNFLANIEQGLAAIELSPKDKFLCLLPMFHSFSWTTCVLTPLRLGVPTVIIESILPFNPVIKYIWKHHVTIFVGVPQIFAALVQKITQAKAFVLRFLNPIRLCVSGAAPLSPAIHKNFEKLFGVPLLEGYGLTEAAPVATLNPLRGRKIGTVGRPLPGVDINIVDDDGHPVPPGEVGEIWIRGKNVMKGYYRKPRETKEVLTREGWLKTGDLGSFDADGYLTIVDRKKDLIIVRGLNVYPQEVEVVIAQDEDVRDVAVVGKKDRVTGDETIRAFVTLKEGKTLDKKRILSLCRQRLASFKIPKEIIVIDEMPKNAIQKILKKELREREEPR
ncbi:MAG: long-chain fatty acid--CoA ligase [Elusimicrobia bacterium]|nr:long-chain fatty acid--CoA ligase [Candidatus Obscuribacterium magneticum]